MELPHIGKNCGFSSCNQLDFLPFECDGCGLTFCLEHRSRESHMCTAVSTSLPAEYSGEKSYSCCIDGCSKRELTPILCNHCMLNFCLNHRVQEDHKCVKLPEKKPEVSKTSQHVQNILEQRANKPLSQPRFTNPKSIQLAAKVKLMKMKGVAVGDQGIPQSERIFFNIVLPKSSSKPSVPMFFSKCWTVGRVIDKIADKLNITNTNNAGSDKKLRLFHADTGCLMPVSSSVAEVMDNTDNLVYNGSSLILEHVPDDTNVLPGVEKYKK
ncbi:AN1-type zinc finger protein 1 isoform X2 [Aplysia californica]|uniref:AN1-type zinc finger protein 1 isoform X2 n=1 Tax=Aplysia californica TaxID=6500 RepID=A0ABM0JZP0_APLCA|nr:AN1-type zinc finger protein 1 isoform X2 [Aplysia californica]